MTPRDRMQQLIGSAFALEPVREEMRDLLAGIYAERERARIRLYSALIQCCADDDRIVREHVRAAYALMGGDLVDLDERNPGGAL